MSADTAETEEPAMDCGRPAFTDDTELLALVSEAAADPPPAWVATAGRGVYTWLWVDADIESLLSDAWRPEMPCPGPGSPLPGPR